MSPSSFRSLIAFYPPQNPTFHLSRSIHSAPLLLNHSNPLGLPRKSPDGRPPPPTMPRRGPPGPPKKTKIPGVKSVVVVASGKGGVGKSTVAVNLAIALSRSKGMSQEEEVDSYGSAGRNPRIGILDLDIFGPSIPKLFNLEKAGEPELSKGDKLLPMRNHGVGTMSMGYLIPQSANNDSPIVWRGLMVMKAVQQLLFDVDWRSKEDGKDHDLDVLVIDMPPGTGDVQLSLGQLVEVDGAIIVSTPQSISLLDARRGIHMFRKVSIPIIGAVLNQSHYVCSCCGEKKELFGDSEEFERVGRELGMNGIGKIPLVPAISKGGDAGLPLMAESSEGRDEGWKESRAAFKGVAAAVWQHLAAKQQR